VHSVVERFFSKMISLQKTYCILRRLGMMSPYITDLMGWIEEKKKAEGELS